MIDSPAGIGGGDKYVSRYSPNLPLRTATIGIAELEDPNIGNSQNLMIV